MELRQLRAFVEVAGHLHFGHAAQALHLTQPALSQRIQYLERELQVRLLTRTSREVRLTPAGEVLLSHAKRMIEEEDRALDAVRAHSSGVAGRLRIAYYTAGDPMLPTHIVAEFRQRFPNVSIELSHGYSVANAHWLRSSEIDVAFVRMPMQDLDGIRVIVVGEEPYVLALPSNHAQAHRRKVRLRELTNEGWVFFPRALNPGQYDHVRGVIEDALGGPLRVVLEEPTEEAMVGSVADGFGICLCSLSRSRLMRVSGVTFRPIEDANLVSSMALLVRSEETGLAVTNFLDLAKTMSPSNPARGELVRRR
jgi:DNA-binding transcriptional LysR family regulator